METNDLHRISGRVHAICQLTGIAECHDYKQPTTVNDIIELLGIIPEHTPKKDAGEKYMIAPKEPKPSPAEKAQPDMWKKLEKIIDDDLQEAIHNYDLKAAKGLLSTFGKVGSTIEDGIDDIQLHLSELRPAIIGAVMKAIPGVCKIEWRDDNRILIHSTMQLDGMEDEIKAQIQEDNQEVVLNRIMSEPKVLTQDTTILIWKWIG